MAQDPKKGSQGRPAPMTQNQVDALVRGRAGSAEIYRLLESHSEHRSVEPAAAKSKQGRAREKGQPTAATPEEVRRMSADPRYKSAESGRSEKMRGQRPTQKPPGQ
jgi:hypothetical protein